jgi:hypothetical protein
MPRSEIRPMPDDYARCEPAWLEGGIARPRQSFVRFFDAAGLSLLDNEGWSGMTRASLTATGLE